MDLEATDTARSIRFLSALHRGRFHYLWLRDGCEYCLLTSGAASHIDKITVFFFPLRTRILSSCQVSTTTANLMTDRKGLG